MITAGVTVVAGGPVGAIPEKDPIRAIPASNCARELHFLFGRAFHV
ncbi:MAG TPA: hypothetical protein VHC43_17370 [Mycobacteriales bacterium]|nr:hypothetical protein [Mycobacteriales bacterium]